MVLWICSLIRCFPTSRPFCLHSGRRFLGTLPYGSLQHALTRGRRSRIQPNRRCSSRVPADQKRGAYPFSITRSCPGSNRKRNPAVWLVVVHSSRCIPAGGMIRRQLVGRSNLQVRRRAVRRGLHSSAAPRGQHNGLLTRDFIARSLYNQDNGYFSTKDVINDLPGPLEFGHMMGELHYRLDVKKVPFLRCVLLPCMFPPTATLLACAVVLPDHVASASCFGPPLCRTKAQRRISIALIAREFRGKLALLSLTVCILCRSTAAVVHVGCRCTSRWTILRTRTDVTLLCFQRRQMPHHSKSFVVQRCFHG